MENDHGRFTFSAAIKIGLQTRADENATGFTQDGMISYMRLDGSSPFSESAFNADGVDVYTKVIGASSLANTSKKSIQKAADKIFDQFVNHDAASNWSHRDILTQGKLNNNNQMGIGIARVKYQVKIVLILVANTGHANN